VAAARYAVIGYGIQIGVAIILLLVGAGLLSLPIGTLIGGLIIRLLSRRACLRLLGDPPHGSQGGEWALVRTLWPNSWRAGLQFLSTYVGVTVPGLLFASHYGLETFAPYGVSHQVMMICMGMALVWMQVKWPLVGQYRARGDLRAVRRLVWPRLWLQNITFILLASCAVVLGPAVLDWIGSGKELLANDLLVVLALVFLLDLQFTFWTTLVSTENRIPSLWPTVITQFVALALYLFFSLGLELGYWALVLAPLVAGGLFNYWYWLFRGTRSMGTTLAAFVLRRDQG
jgi:Na+-driven multidrug efflux pump